MKERAEQGGVGAPGVEVVTSLLFVAVGALALWDYWRIGAGWAADGPEAGYFPSLVALVLILASLVNVVQVLRGRGRGSRFATWPQLRLVLAVVALGGFSWRAAVPTGLAVAAAAFLTFEIWFLVALPKGPLETLLGY